jgi:adenine deaminase
MSGDTDARRALADVALGLEPADLVVRGGRVVEVHTGALVEADVAISGDRIAAVGDVAHAVGERTEIHDVAGACLTPGFIDCHMHAGESQLGMTELARLLVSRGTAAISTCFYEAGQVAGYAGVEHFLDEAGATPLKVLLSPFVSAYRGLGPWGNPGRFTGEDLIRLLDRPECVEIREWSVGAERGADPAIDRFVDAARRKGKLLGGHLEGLDGPALQASAALGVSSEHEALTAEEALAKARLGVRIQIRQGSYGWDLEGVIRAVTELGADPRLFMFCTDGAEAYDLATQGHVDHIVRRAIAAGVDPVTAVQMATLNAAEYFRVTGDLGSIAPGRYAHLNVVPDLDAFEVSEVIADGRLVARDSAYVEPLARPRYPAAFYETMNVGRQLEPSDFEIAAPEQAETVVARVIGVREGSVRTEELLEQFRPRDGLLHPDPARDVAKIAVIDRHEASGRIGTGFVKGFGLARGAIATSMSPALMNLMAVGVGNADMAIAANRVQEMNGGIAAVADGRVMAEVPLPVLGFASDASAEELIVSVSRFEAARRSELGSSFRGFLMISGFTMMTISLPGLRISDRGPVMVARDGPREVDLVASLGAPPPQRGRAVRSR